MIYHVQNGLCYIHELVFQIVFLNKQIKCKDKIAVVRYHLCSYFVSSNCSSSYLWYPKKFGLGETLRESTSEGAFRRRLWKNDLKLKKGIFARVFKKSRIYLWSFETVIRKTFSERTCVTPVQRHVSHCPRNLNPIKTQLQFTMGG